jgi:outer membrane protein OmpA-like peptidoglycan-associated protein
MLTGPAWAQEQWLVQVEAPGAFALSTPQSDLFRPGGMPAATLYRSLAPVALAGLRVRGGLLGDGAAPVADPNRMEPGAGGLLGLGLALRIRPLPGTGLRRGNGPWVEVAGGAVVTGDALRGSFEVGAGWGFATGRLNVGPVVRYLQIVQPSHPIDDRDARLALLGVELSLFEAAPPPPALAPVVPPVPRMPAAPAVRDIDADAKVSDRDDCPDMAEDMDLHADVDGCPDPDNDGDRIADSSDACPDAAEVVNGVNDQDGCPDEGVIVMVDDRVVLDERILFDTRRARVKRSARRALLAIIELWRQHPEWEKMIVEGHTDVRGDPQFNQWLSELRAERVKQALLKLGMAAETIETVGHGMSRPRTAGTTEEAHQSNRRVEFVRVQRAATPAPKPAEGTQP